MTRPEVPLVESLLEHAARHPGQAAIIARGETVTYTTFARMVRTAAARVRRCVGGHGERVALCGPNSQQLAAAYFAVHMAGAVAVLLDADIPEESARWVIDDANVRLTLAAMRLDLPGNVQNLAEWCQPGEDEFLGLPSAELADPSDLVYTTGTTGRKKGVLLTHANIAQAARNINSFIGTRGDDVEVMPLPLSHSFGLGRLRCMAQAGHCLLLLPGMRNPAMVLKQLLDVRATGLALVPAGIELVLRMTRDRLGDAAGHLRYVEIGSAALPPDVKQRMMDLLPQTRICHHYGLTEASRAAFLEYHSDRDHLASIGRPSPNVEMAVHDEAGKTLPDGQEGEISVRGGMVLSHYWKQPDLTRDALRDGWLRTGDRGYRDAEGYYYLSGRQNDVVNVGGRKVNPEEIEHVLNGHPAVVESACIGVPDPQGILGHCLKACIVLRGEVSDDQLIQWLRQRVEEHKIPRVWQRVEKIAKTVTGKIQRHLM
jgi:long-chain acyl-CoA synthetase